MVSIIIPTHNASSSLERLLEALFDQTLRGEILVVDSSSTDETTAIARRAGARILEIRREDFDHGGTRNLAVRHVSGDIVVFMTQDAIPADRMTIEKLVTPLETDDTVAAVYGRQIPKHGATPFAAHSRFFNYGDASYVRSLSDAGKGIKSPFLSNSLAAYRRRILEEIGMFRENLISTEDTYAGARMLIAGYRIAYSADAVVLHSHNYSVLEEFRRYFDIGVFHKKERWITDIFGGAEGEGMRYLRSEMRFLLESRRWQFVPEYFLRNALKYCGFKLGQLHEMFPRFVARSFSMNKGYWHRG